MAVNLGSNKGGYKTGPGGKIIPNRPAGSSADTAVPSRGGGPTGYDPVGLGVSSKYRGQKPARYQQGTSRQGELLRFPVDNIQAYPAYIKFEPYKVDAYEIDEETATQYFDTPLLSEFMQSEPQSNQSEADKSVATGSYDDGVVQMQNEDAVFDRQPDADDEEGGVFAADPQFQAKNESIRGAALRKKFTADRNAKKQAELDARRGRFKTNLAAQSAVSDGSNLITLYLPQSLVYADNVAYRDVNLGTTGLAALGALNQGGTLTKAVAEGVKEGLTDLFGIFGSGMNQAGAELLAARLINKIPGSGGVQGAASTALQTGINPGTRILFDRPNLREFTFNFKLIPRSPGEADQIERIIRSFREEMYPEAIDVAGIPIGFKFPNVFYISMGIAGSDIKLPQIQYAYLRNVTTTYNPTAGVFMEDGHPNEVDLSLTFQEYRPLVKQDIQDGY